MEPKAPFKSVDDSPRLIVPLALIHVLELLIEELGTLPDYRRNELRSIQRKLRVMYKIKEQRSVDPVLDEQVCEELANAPIEDETLARTYTARPHLGKPHR